MSKLCPRCVRFWDHTKANIFKYENMSERPIFVQTSMFRSLIVKCPLCIRIEKYLKDEELKKRTNT